MCLPWASCCSWWRRWRYLLSRSAQGRPERPRASSKAVWTPVQSDNKPTVANPILEPCLCGFKDLLCNAWCSFPCERYKHWVSRPTLASRLWDPKRQIPKAYFSLPVCQVIPWVSQPTQGGLTWDGYFEALGQPEEMAGMSKVYIWLYSLYFL